MFLKSYNTLLDAVFPNYCVICSKKGSAICPDCLSLIQVSEYIWCPYCPMPTRVFLGQGVCPKHKNLYLNGLFSATTYQDKIAQKLITQFKYPPYLKNLSYALTFLIIAHFKILSQKK